MEQSWNNRTGACRLFLILLCLFVMPYSNISYADQNTAPIDPTPTVASIPAAPLTKSQRADILNSRVAQAMADSAKKLWAMINEDTTQAPKNWFGLRNKLAEKGVSFNFLYTEDSAWDVSGGIKKGFAYMDDLDMQMTIDTEKMKLWHGGTFYMYGIMNGGNAGLSSKFSGDIQTASNLQVPSPTTHLMELWYQQLLMHDSLSVLVGVHNLNADFDLSTYGKLFINSSFGIEPTMSANFTAPIYPLGSPAVRLSFKLNDSWTLLAGIFDGNPVINSDYNPNGFNIGFNKKHGMLDIAEADYAMKIKDYRGGDALPGDVKLGSWYYAHSMNDVSNVQGDGTPVTHGGDWGIYGVIDQMVFRQKDNQGLSVFLQESGTPTNRNIISNYTGFGINYVGLLPLRAADTFGVAYNIANFSHKFKDNSIYNGFTAGLEGAERVLEITYLIQVAPTITLQPDIQFITNPYGDPTIKDATAFILRGTVSF